MMILHSYMLVYQRVHGQSESNQQRIFCWAIKDWPWYVAMWMFHFHTGRLVLLKCLWTAPIFDETIPIIEVFLWNWPFVPSPMLKLLSSKYQPIPQILVPPQLTDFAASRLYHHRGLGEVVGSSTPDKDAGNRHRGSWCWGTFGNLVISSNCPRIKGKFTATPTYFLGKSMVDFPSNQSIEVSSADGDVCRKDGDSPSQKAGGWAPGISGISFIWSSKDTGYTGTPDIPRYWNGLKWEIWWSVFRGQRGATWGHLVEPWPAVQEFSGRQVS